MTIGTRKASARRGVLAAAVAIAVFAAASASFGQAGGRDYTVTMSNMDYGAIPANLKVGDTIVWMNHDTVQHSVTARDHSFDVRLNPGQSARMTLDRAGRIPFICQFHPTMRGTLAVTAK